MKQLEKNLAINILIPVFVLDLIKSITRILFLIIGLITNKEVGDVVPKFLVEVVSVCESRDCFIILTSFSCLVEDTSWTENRSVRTYILYNFQYFLFQDTVLVILFPPIKSRLCLTY